MHLHNVETRRTIRAFIPTRLEMIALPIFSLLFLVAVNSFRFIRNVDGQNYVQVVEYVQLRFRETLSYFDQLLGATIPLVLFWMFIGVIAYVLLWLIISAWQLWREDLPPDSKRMIVPKEYNHAKVLRGTIVHILTRIIAAILLAIWIYLFFAEILPFMSRLFMSGLETISVQTTYRSLLACLGLATSSFVISILSRCVVLRDRVFS